VEGAQQAQPRQEHLSPTSPAPSAFVALWKLETLHLGSVSRIPFNKITSCVAKSRSTKYLPLGLYVFYPNKSIDTTYLVLVSANDYITVICFIDGDLGTEVIDNKTPDKKSTKALSVSALTNPKKSSALAVDYWYRPLKSFLRADPCAEIWIGGFYGL
jgi:hypothetical protein